MAGNRYVRAACWGKAGYATHAEALAVAARVIAQTHERIITYRCRECHQWHVGGTSDRPLDPRIDPKRWKNWNWRRSTEND